MNGSWMPIESPSFDRNILEHLRSPSYFIKLLIPPQLSEPRAVILLEEVNSKYPERVAV
jgi:hypothetical protein